MKDIKILFLFACLLLITKTIIAQEDFFNKHANLPPVDLCKVPVTAYEKGRILIKVKPEIYELLPAEIMTVAENEFVATGIKSIDELNKSFNVHTFTPRIEGIHYPDFNKNEFMKEYGSWGFHLWIELKCDLKTDIIQAVQSFQALEEIQLAEPVYKKKRNGTIDPDKLTKAITQPNEKSDWIPNDPLYIEQWNMDIIDMPLAWNIEKGRNNVIVAIIDEGIKYNHPDIASNMWSGIGWNFVDNNSTIYPDAYTTHMAGIVAAVSNNSIGVAGIGGGSGSGNGVQLMSLQIFHGEDYGSFFYAVLYARDHGAAILLNNWSYEDPDVYNDEDIDVISAFNSNTFIGGGGDVLAGGISVFGSGIENSSANYYPACYFRVLSVAATDDEDVKAYYSNYGDWVDISAPGGSPYSFIKSTILNNNYGISYGSGMASAHATGAAALFISLMSRYGIMLTGYEVRDILIDNVDDHYPQNPNYIGELGSGRLNAYKALSDFPNYLPANIVLDSINTTGTYTASQSVIMNPGFTTGSSTFVAEVYGSSKGNSVKIFFHDTIIREFQIETDYSTVYPDLWQGNDSSGKKVEPGEYLYEINKDGIQVETGKIIIE